MKQHVDYQMLLADSRGAKCQMSVDYTVAGGSQTGEVWIPVGEPPYPAIMFVHGGCWSSAFDLIHARGMCRAFADLGYWVWLPEYRRLGEPGGGWPATFDDIACAGEWLRQRSSEDIDPHRLYLVGHSAGGHLALWLMVPRFKTDLKRSGVSPLPGRKLLVLLRSPISIVTASATRLVKFRPPSCCKPRLQRSRQRCRR